MANNNFQITEKLLLSHPPIKKGIKDILEQNNEFQKEVVGMRKELKEVKGELKELKEMIRRLGPVSDPGASGSNIFS